MIEENSVLQYKGQKRSGGFLKWLPLTIVIVLIWLGVSVITGFATSGSKKYVVAETPEEALEKYVEKTYPSYADSYTPVLIDEYNQLAVILYELPSGPTDAIYYQLVRHNGSEWYINDRLGEGGHHGLYSGEELGAHIEWGIDYVLQPIGTVLYGKAVSDEVAAVEVDFHHSGQTTRVAVKDGWFVIMLGISDKNDAIRVLDGDGEVLAEKIWPDVNG